SWSLGTRGLSRYKKTKISNYKYLIIYAQVLILSTTDQGSERIEGLLGFMPSSLRYDGVQRFSFGIVRKERA
ncbi:MAG: hypothetical protein KAI83_03835, partial [Thiomargarita sp.]|nr:hypothetical protein [Thiomargarita sp.]